MLIDKKLNLVIPVERGDQTIMYVHSTPIMQETFETNYMVLAKTWAQLMSNGLDPRSGPSVAALVMKDVAMTTARALGVSWWEGPDGVNGERGLMAEMIRLSNAVVPSTEKGWASTPLQVARDQKLLSEDEFKEVINRITFFTVISHIAPRADRESLILGMAVMYGLQTTSSNCTAWATSLKTSIAAENTGETAPA